MSTRFNYTDRRKLLATEAYVKIMPASSGPATFKAYLDFSKLLDLADKAGGKEATRIRGARVFVEAFQQTTRMRFDYGTVEKCVEPTEERRVLSEFESWELVRFRVKVTDVLVSEGRIIAWRDRFSPENGGEIKDLLRFANKDLAGRVWDMEFDDDGPVVLIDTQTGDKHVIGRDRKFIAAVFPEILRRTLIYALVEEQMPRDEGWVGEWLENFVKPQFEIKDPPPVGDPVGILSWIDEVVGGFCIKIKFNELWQAVVKEND
jgi:hypothetical protein